MGERRDQATVGRVSVMPTPGVPETRPEPASEPEPSPDPPTTMFRCEAAGFRAARMVTAAFTELATTFAPQVAAQLAVDLTKTVLTTPSGAKILEE